jgi:hypothetical protein
LIVAGAAGYYFWQGSLQPSPDVASNTPRPGRTEPANEPRVVFSGNVGKVETLPGTSLDPGSGSGKDKAIILRSTVKQALLAPSPNTAYLNVPQNIIKDLSGKRVAIVVWARRLPAEGQAPFAIGYSAGPAGSSGWTVFSPTSDFKAFRFSYRMPARLESSITNDRIAIWPDIDGARQGLEIRLVTIESAN